MPIDQMHGHRHQAHRRGGQRHPGIELVKSVTSRGTAEMDLYFSWKVDMFQTLEWVNAALIRARGTLPPSTTLMAERLTFAAFSIMGYSLTSDTVSQTRLWELATYEMKPRLNRLTACQVVGEGLRSWSFEIRLNGEDAAGSRHRARATGRRGKE